MAVRLIISIPLIFIRQCLKLPYIINIHVESYNQVSHPTHNVNAISEQVRKIIMNLL